VTARRSGAAAAIVALLAIAAGPAVAQDAAPANTLHDLGARLEACLKTGHSRDGLANGSEVTVLFALKRDGSLMGRPRITHSSLIGGVDDQKLL
jgi:hypothetical protein